MSNILWVLNKYVDDKEQNRFFPFFLAQVQNNLHKLGHTVHFVLFSELLADNKQIKNKHVYNNLNVNINCIEVEAQRIESEYEFTFKQAYFPDIIQTFKNRNHRKINVPKNEFENIDFLVPRFVYLERLILEYNIDVIFSDVSPEAEMEFGRAIGNKLGKLVLKTGEGVALGRMVLFRLLSFGKDDLVEAKMTEFSNTDSLEFCNNFIKDRKLPYNWPKRNKPDRSLKNRLLKRFKNGSLIYLLYFPFLYLRKRIEILFYSVEYNVLKPMLYDNFVSTEPYLFMGLHLNQESTMVLRAQPYTNQTALVEMVARVLPHGYTLYVRAHPHWPHTFAYSYLSKMSKYPKVKIISDKIPIHDIIRNCKGILTYNATTGIEALMYGKPVLSFASSAYRNHPAVDYCGDLYELGSKLVKLVNREVNIDDTVSMISKLISASVDFRLGADCFFSISDCENKGGVFAKFLDNAIEWCASN